MFYFGVVQLVGVVGCAFHFLKGYFFYITGGSTFGEIGGYREILVHV
jgi:hypothetical protein